MEDITAFKNEDLKYQNYFGKFKIVYRLCGLSVDGNESVAYQTFSFLLILFLNFLYVVIRIFELFKVDKETFFAVVMYPYALMLGFVKTLMFMRNRIRLGQLLDKLQQKPFLPNPNRGGIVEEKLMRKCLQIIKIQSFAYSGSILFVGVVCALVALGLRISSNDYHHWLFPYGPFTLLNVTYSPAYEIWWFYENSSMVVHVVHFTVIDSTVGAVLAYVTFQFKILQNNIKQIVEISYREMLKETGNIQNFSDLGIIDASMVPWKYLKKSLAEAINYHLEINGVAAEMEELFNSLMLFVFLNSLGMMCVLIAHPAPLTTAGVFVIAGQLLVSCFWGEQMMFESQQVGQAAFEANFVGADARFQKSLVLIIRRSKNPVVITAGKFAAVCLATSTWILRSGYSASTVLRQVK